jgi:hypothetical protein
MKTRRCRMLVRLVLVLATLCWGVGLAGAQMQKGGKSAQTGPRRSPQNVMQMNKTTQAQRRAAAARNAARKAAAGQKNQVGANAQREVKK